MGGASILAVWGRAKALGGKTGHVLGHLAMHGDVSGQLGG